jgi:hypothetical protein
MGSDGMIRNYPHHAADRAGPAVMRAIIVPSLGRDAAKGIAGLLADGSQEDAYEMPTSQALQGPEGMGDDVSPEVEGCAMCN